MDGALRVSAVEVGPQPDLPNEVILSWPTELDLSQFFLRTEDEYSLGVGRSVTVAEEVVALRRLRDSYLMQRDARSAGFGSALRVSDGKRGALVFMRDELPFTDAQGLIQFGGSR
jgi:hypothetical protein